MKKVLFMLMFVILLFNGVKVNASISENFSKTISIMEIPEKNLLGYEINEDMYNKYNLIVYGTPQDVIKNQRWKDVKNGKWKNEISGKTGEYRILGYSLTGTVVNNELFPDDAVSGKSPEEWEYIVIEDALSSWNDTEKYQTKEQYDYMVTQKLTRNGTTYNITALDIGLDKARLEAYATWKTAGSIFTLKYDDRGILWGATFNVPPFSANADVEAELDFVNGTTYTIEKDKTIIEIPFSYGAKVVNLSEFAKPEHVKKLSSEIEIQYELFDKITGEKTLNVTNDDRIIIDKTKYGDLKNIEIIVRNTAILETCFSTEAPIVDIKEITLNINLGDEDKYINVKDVNVSTSDEIPKPYISSIKLYRKSIYGEDDKVPLLVAKKTNTQFISAGQVLIIEAKINNEPTDVKFYIEGDSKIQILDELTKKFLYDEPKSRNEKLMYSSVNALRNSYNLPIRMENENGKYVVEYIIPYGAKQSIHSWNTLREINKNALNIDTSKLLSRICEPYKIKIRATNEGGTTTKSISLDVFERWDTVYNRDISEYVK